MNAFHTIFSHFQPYLQLLLNYFVIFTKQEVCIQKQKFSRDEYKSISYENDDDDDEEEEEIKLRKGDIQFVMGRLGLTDSEFEGEVYEGFGEKEIAILFEEKEPSLEEVKKAFDVFDVNKDGFIDERELQRIVCGLDLISSNDEGGLEIVEKCRRMIRAVDANGDGRIDFHEFVTCMDKCFC